MEKTYKTAQVAQIIGVHPNTVRLYEKLELIPKAYRQPNGYRAFTDFHIEQFRLARTAFKVEILQNGLRKKIIDIIKLSAKGEFDLAIDYINKYISQIVDECTNAEEAIEISKNLLCGVASNQDISLSFTRKQAAQYLNVTIDTLRNWELNGLLTVRRKQNGYRIYTNEDIQRLKIIKALRCANYSLSAILRMLNAVSKNTNIDIREVINSPKDNEDIVSACDKLLTSLKNAQTNAYNILFMLKKMKTKKYFIV